MSDYIELANEAEAEALELELAKAHAKKEGIEYPFVPDVVGPGRFPCGLMVATPYADLTPEQQALVPKQPRFVRARELADDVYLLAVDAKVAALHGVIVDGKSVDVLTARKDESALSAKAKTALGAADAKAAAPAVK